jgi:hypothetical protein
MNGNGIWDRDRKPPEPGVSGWTILLTALTEVDLNGDGKFDDSDFLMTQTNTEGAYWFKGLPFGRYQLSEQPRVGWRQTTSGGTSEDGQIVRDPNLRNYVIQFSDLPSERVYEHVNFGNQREASGSIHGLKWLDINVNGDRDPDEPGIAGVRIFVDLDNDGNFDENEPPDKPEPSAVTDSDGSYSITGLLVPEDYVVREVVPDGYRTTFPLQAFSYLELPASGMTSDPNAVEAFAVTTDGTLYVNTGGAKIGSLGFEVGDGDISMNPADGSLYVLSSTDTDKSLYRLNIQRDATGFPQLRGSTKRGSLSTANDPSALAFDHDGRLFVLDLNNSTQTLLEVNPNDASILGATTIELPDDLPMDGINTAGMDYDLLLHWFVIATPVAFYAINHDGQVLGVAPMVLPGLAAFDLLDDRAHYITLTSTLEGINFGNVRLTPVPDGNDTIHALGGDDTVHGDNVILNPLYVTTGSREDKIFGGEGVDRLFGQEKNDILWGDEMLGASSSDYLDGGSEEDEVRQTVDTDQVLTNSLLTGQGPDQLVSIERATLTGGDGLNALNAQGERI